MRDSADCPQIFSSQAAIERFDRLANAYREAMVGTVQEVLFEQPEEGLFAGHAMNYVKVYAEGGATLTPSVGWSGAYVLYDNAKPINGVPYTRIGIGGKLYFSLSGEIYVQGGVKLNPEFSFPITLPTTIPFVDAKAELIFGDYLGVEGKVSGGFEVWCNPRICMGVERWGTEPWQLLKPFDFSVSECAHSAARKISGAAGRRCNG